MCERESEREKELEEWSVKKPYWGKTWIKRKGCMWMLMQIPWGRPGIRKRTVIWQSQRGQWVSLGARHGRGDSIRTLTSYAMWGALNRVTNLSCNWIILADVWKTGEKEARVWDGMVAGNMMSSRGGGEKLNAFWTYRTTQWIGPQIGCVNVGCERKRWIKNDFSNCP